MDNIFLTGLFFTRWVRKKKKLKIAIQFSYAPQSKSTKKCHLSNCLPRFVIFFSSWKYFLVKREPIVSPFFNHPALGNYKQSLRYRWIPKARLHWKIWKLKASAIYMRIFQRVYNINDLKLKWFITLSNPPRMNFDFPWKERRCLKGRTVQFDG